jgi:glycosyltransferase involved in cell wall biosynthesis
MSKKLPITSIVASLNEGHILADCLSSVAFTDEVLVVNLESTDNTVEIATAANATIIDHKRVPVVEIIHTEMSKKSKNDWLLLTDPDERIGESLADDLRKELPTYNKEKIGVVYAPMQYYFKKKRLRGGVWGGIKQHQLLANRQRAVFSPNVHNGVKLRDGYVLHHMQYHNDNVIHHYWMSSYRQLFEKHNRYIKAEGKARYDNGVRYSTKLAIKTPLTNLYDAYIREKGYKDGLTGFFLACFWAWYNSLSIQSLKKYERSLNAKK